MSEQKCAVALGFFDGVHIGHRALLARLGPCAGEGGRRVALAFANHPMSVLCPERAPSWLTSPEEKRALMLSAGADEAILPPFTGDTAQLSAEDFARGVFGTLGASVAVVGRSYRFGRGALGDPALLARVAAQFGARVEVVDEVLLGGEPVSSTRIRAALARGDLSAVRAMLGRDHSVSGPVVRGRGLGSRELLPTANIDCGSGRALPMCGVYAGRLECAGRVLPAVINVGDNPTVGGRAITVEAHAIEGGGDMYGMPARAVFMQFIRPEQRFAGVDGLRAQMMRDVARARALLGL